MAASITQERLVLALRDAGKTNAEVAAATGLTKGQVSGLIFRARSALYRDRSGPTVAGLERHVARFMRHHGAADTQTVLRRIAESLSGQ